jgi:PAS domain S-box-containing protein
MRISKRYLKSLFTSVAWWLGVAISIVFYLLATQMVEDKTAAQFDYQVRNSTLAIQARFQSYVEVLRGASALFHSSNRITRAEFRTYVEQLNLERSFPGITNLNIARHIPARDAQAFERSVRSDTSLDKRGYPDFSITPPGERAAYHVLTYIEPMASNSKLLGLDIALNKAIARTLAVSRDSGKPLSLSRPALVTGPYSQVGLAIRMPLYRPGMPLDTVAERQTSYFGSVGAGFDIDKLMEDTVDASILPHMRIRLYDSDTGEEALASQLAAIGQPFFDNKAAQNEELLSRPGYLFVKRAPIRVGSNVWEAEFSASKAAMRSRFDVNLPPLVLSTGLLATLLLYSIYYSLMSANRRAVELANDMTKDLRASEASLAEAQRMSHLGSWLLEPVSRKMTWSAETHQIFGIDRLWSPRYDDFLFFLHPEDRQRIHDGLQQSIATGEEFNTEHRIMQSDGTVRWVQTISRPSRNEGKQLLRGTVMDITERKETMEALKRSQDLLRELTAHQDRVKEEERRRIAREIHDELGQTLLALRIDVAMLDTRTGKTHPRLNEKVRDALHHIDATVKTIRTIINNLRPAVLDLGLTAAIEWQVNEFRRRTGIACELFMSEKEFELDDNRATTLFRILQESLTNVIRHANASRVVIELYKQDGKLVMRITDNGIGIYPDRRKTTNSFGLIGVEERIHALNGNFSIASTPGKGVVLTIFIPLESTEKETHARLA